MTTLSPLRSKPNQYGKKDIDYGKKVSIRMALVIVYLVVKNRYPPGSTPHIPTGGATTMLN